ncbi:MAG: hypothetical protein ABI625_10005 [bacterium]
MSLVTAVLLAAPLALLQPAHTSCDLTRRGTRTSSSGTHVDADDNGGSSLITFSHSERGRCTSATIIGRLRYSDAEDDIIEMPFGSHAMFSEQTENDLRELTITRGQDGAIVHQYRHNGAAAAFDDDARRWLAGFLPAILMDASINVVPRVARWRAQGGVDNVLAHIATMSSSGAKRSHYEALIAGERLSNTDLDKVVRQAGQNIESSGDLRSVLEKAVPTQRGGLANDRDVLLSVMRAARSIQSSGDKAGLLQQRAQRYLSANDEELSRAFFQVALTIPSSGDLRSVLQAAVPLVANSAEQTLMLIDASRNIPSSGDRADVLVSLVGSGALKSQRVRDAFFDVAATIPSNGDRSRVLDAAGRRQ